MILFVIDCCWTQQEGKLNAHFWLKCRHICTHTYVFPDPLIPWNTNNPGSQGYSKSKGITGHSRVHQESICPCSYWELFSILRILQKTIGFNRPNWIWCLSSSHSLPVWVWTGGSTRLLFDWCLLRVFFFLGVFFVYRFRLWFIVFFCFLRSI